MFLSVHEQGICLSDFSPLVIKPKAFLGRLERLEFIRTGWPIFFLRKTGVSARKIAKKIVSELLMSPTSVISRMQRRVVYKK